MKPTDQRMVQLPYGYPSEVKDWVKSFIFQDPQLQSERQSRICERRREFPLNWAV